MPRFEKRIKPQSDASDDGQDADDVLSDDSSPSVIDTGAEGEILSSSESEDQDDPDESENEKSRDSAHAKLRSIDFGTLAKAQDSLTRKRKRDSDTTPAHQEKLAALRERLRELREKSQATAAAEAKTGRAREQAEETEDGSDSDSDQDSEEDTSGKPRSRSSKHAPTSQPSNRQVTRKRIAIDTPKNKSRDPRFVNASGFYDPNKIAKTYSFLDTYRDSELTDLKTQLKKSNKPQDAQRKQQLKLQIAAEENRKRARDARERAQAVVREHRAKEKEAVSRGKKPYFLKPSEVKQQALVKRFESMKPKERTKVMDKKQRKEGQRAKRSMPAARRIA